jgi:hypothetical protein
MPAQRPHMPPGARRTIMLQEADGLGAAEAGGQSSQTDLD